MARIKVTLDHAAVGRMLRGGQFAGAVHSAAKRVNDNAIEAMPTNDADGEKFPTRIDDYVTDRTVSAVVIDHPAGERVEAKHGTLIRAAAAAGLEVHDHD